MTKLNPAGAIVYSTYLGGNGDDQGYAIAIGPVGTGGNNTVYVTGATTSTDFPTTSDKYQVANHGGYDGFITVLDGGAGTVSYSTYLGGSGDDIPIDIAVDGVGSAYVTGLYGFTRFPHREPCSA